MLQIKTKNIKNGWKILVTVLLIVCIFAAFWLFLQDNKRRATSISTKSLKEVTVRSSFQIDESLNSAKREILLVETLYGKLLEDEEVTATDLKKVLHEISFDYIGYATLKGDILNSKGDKTDISGRDYFKDAIKGNSGVSVVFNSSFTKEKLFVFIRLSMSMGK